MLGRPLRARDKQRLFVAAMTAAALLACVTVAYPAIVRPDPKLTRARKHLRVVVRGWGAQPGPGAPWAAPWVLTTGW